MFSTWYDKFSSKIEIFVKNQNLGTRSTMLANVFLRGNSASVWVIELTN